MLHCIMEYGSTPYVGLTRKKHGRMASQMLQKSTTSVDESHDVVTHTLQRREYTRRRQRTPTTSGVLRAFHNVVSAT